MAEERDHNAFEKGSDDVGEMPDDFIPEDAWPICPNCLTPCDRLQYYCEKCGSNEPMNPLASYMPFVRIRFHAGMYGRIWRRIWDDRGIPLLTRIFYVFVLLMGAPVMLFVGLPWAVAKIRSLQLRIATAIGFVILLIVLVLTLAKTNQVFYLSLP